MGLLDYLATKVERKRTTLTSGNISALLTCLLMQLILFNQMQDWQLLEWLDLILEDN
jgi:hypothetical protein